MARIASGIEGLDALVGGGLPEGSSIILQGPSGLEKLQFALTFLAEGLKTGGSGVLVVASQTAESILSELRSRGVDLDAVAKENRLRIVDWYSWSEDRITDVEERGIILRSTIDLSSLGAALSRAIAALPNGPGKRAVVEMLSPALNVYELTQVYAFAQSAKRKFDRFAFTSFFLVEKDMHDESVLSTLAQPFDGVIELERTRAGDRIVRKLGVLHLKDTTPPASFVPLEQTEKGFRVLLPQAPAPVPAFTPAEAAPTPGPKKTITPPLAEPESAEARTTRVQLINQIAEERLRVDPADKDAWFALAAGQAILRDVQGSLKSLEKLAALDPRYPGLWVLKAKLHARLGQEEEWRQARMKADEFEEPSTGPAAGLVPCPVCNQPVAPETSLCPHCGSRTEPEKDIIEELEALTKATIQDLVEESAHQTVAGPEVPPAAKPKAKPTVKPEEEPLIDVDKSLDELAALVAEPAPAPPKASAKARSGEARKGLTNGLVFGRKRERAGTAKGGRTNGLTNGLRGRTNGLTNGLGRTNGLTNGLRGRTNGLTNGLGRTNGLTNGLRGRTNGLTNGLGGRTNGLTNGLRGRTNGLTNGLGRTNGLTNGVGRTNGLTNGLVKVAKQRGFFGHGRASWQRLGLAATLVVLIILLPIVFFWSGPTVSYPIQVDGQFGDWAGVTKVAALPPRVAPNPDVQITQVAVKDNLDFLAFYLQVRGNVLSGGPAPDRVTNSYFAFVDTDRSGATGYQVEGIGANRMIRIDTWGGQIVSSSLMEFDQSRGARDWNGWVSLGSVEAAGSGNQLEFQVSWTDLAQSRSPVNVAFASRSWQGESYSADAVVTDAVPFVLVSQDTRGPPVLSSATPVLATFTFHADGGDVSISSLNVTFQGTFQPTSLSSVALVDSSGTTVSTQNVAATVRFPLTGFTVPRDTNRTLTVQPSVQTADGTTVGALLQAVNDVAVGSGGVAFRNPTRTAASLAYVGSVSSVPVVDGGFSDWPNVTRDPIGDVQPVWNPDVDLSGYAFQGHAGSTYFMAETVATALNGTMIPAFNPRYLPPSNGTGNGTVTPGSPPPPENGTDMIRFFLDEDGSSSSGYSIGGIGADLLVEITGKEGLVLTSQVKRFNGTSPTQWAWMQVGAAPVAKDGSRVEASIPGISVSNVSRAFFEVLGWGASFDDSSAGSPPVAISSLDGAYLPGYVGTDPTGITDVSGTAANLGGPNQRNVFYDGTNFWAFYFDGTLPGANVWYESSSDGLSWVNPRSQAFTTASVDKVSTWFYSNATAKVVYIVGDTGSGQTVVVRRGTISGTTISWSVVNTVTVSGKTAAKSPFICRDSSGYLWIGTNVQENSGYNFAVARSANPDDVTSTWQASTDMMATGNASAAIQGVVLPLSSGQVYALWYADGWIAGRLFSGGSWGTVEGIATTTSGNLTKAPSAVVDSSFNIHLVYVNSTGVVRYRERTSSWGSAVSLDTTTGNSYPTITYETSTGYLDAFWIASTNQISAVRHASSWTSVTVETNTRPKTLLTSLYNVSAPSNVAWAWSQTATTNWDIKFSVMSSSLSSRTIDTSTSNPVASYNHQRKIFYDGTYFWAFYNDGTTTRYTYSANGLTWENPIRTPFTTAGVFNPSLWYYSNATAKVVYVVGDTVTNGKTVTVQRGTISGTTISWGTDQSASISPSNLATKVAFITRDSGGNLWIVSLVASTANTYNAYVTKSQSADSVATWGTSVPLLTTDLSSASIYPTILPLSGGDMYAFWYANGAIAGRKYTSSNSTWGPIEGIASANASVSTKIPSAVVDASYNVNLVFSDINGAIVYRQRTSAWQANTTLDSNGGGTSPTITLEEGTGNLYAFWISSTYQIKGSRYTGSSWVAVTGIDTSTITKVYLTSLYRAPSAATVAMLWGQGSTVTNEVKFALAIPEFQEVALPVLSTLGFVSFVGHRFRRRSMNRTDRSVTPSRVAPPDRRGAS